MLITPGAKPVAFKFREAFRKDLLARPVQWNIPGLSEFTFIRTYARKKDNGKLETWNECVVRVIEGMFTILRTHAKFNLIPWDDKRGQKLAQEAAERMFVFKWLPPGRGLWMMGTPFIWEKGAGALNNPLGLDTRVYTKEHGFIRIGDLDGSDVTVVARDPETFAQIGYQTASVSAVETQDCVEIKYRTRFGTERSVISSKTHRWWRKATTKVPFERVAATNLAVGDYLPRTTQPRNYKPSPVGMAHGFFFGDGTRSNGELHVFAPQKAHVLTRLFPAHQIDETGRTLESGLKNRCVRQLPLAWGDIPSDAYRQDKRYLLGFLMGYFAADGCVSDTGPVAITSAQIEELQAVAELFEEIGIETSISDAATPSQFVDERELWKLTINRADIDVDFFLRIDHATKFQRLKIDKNLHKIIEISDVGPREVRCLTVPNAENFMIEGFLTTSNCGFVSTENMGTSVEETVKPFTFLMDMSMLGVGVGFDTRGAKNDIRVLGFSDEVETYVIEDTRESWVEYIGTVIKNAIYGFARLEPDVSKVRPAGMPIRGFGGTSSGPDPLLDCGRGVAGILQARAGQTLTSTDIVDLQNLIGKCVVAGNVRRTAEIAFADADDSDFFEMKNWSKAPVETGGQAPDELKLLSQEDYDAYNANLWNTQNGIAKGIVEKYKDQDWAWKFGGWRWASNNSMFATVGQDYRKYESSIKEAGEPGFAWLDLMRSHGRLKDPANNRDYRVKGGNPCLEQSLESYELCCLVETFPSYHADYWDYQRSLKFAYMYAKTVTLMGTHDERTNAVMIRNRRIGCSMSGVADAIAKFGRTPYMREFCDNGYNYICYVDKKYSEWLGVPESIKKTSTKPSGTTSLVAGVFGPGLHFAKMASGYRLIRVAANSDLVPLLKAADFRVEPSVTDPLRTVVVYFPWLTPEGIITEDEATIWEKFKIVADLQYWWADNQTSATVEFSKEEADRGEIARCLEAFDGQLKGISLLPASSGGAYAQMPFTPAPRAEVEEYILTLGALDFSVLTQEGEAADANRFCDSSGCSV